MGFEQFFYRIPEFVSLLAGILTALLAVIGGFRSGALKKVRVGSIELEGSDKESLARITAEIASARSGDPIPFEIEQLASYYSVTLGQAKVSFWFSLIFASIGFVVIIGAAFLYRDGDLLGASIKITSGLVIDAVAALFFVQSRRAQEAMGAFFEKLRTDRQFIEARKICDEIQSDTLKDNLKTVLALHYSGLQPTGMLDVLAGIEPVNHTSPPSPPPPQRPRKPSVLRPRSKDHASLISTPQSNNGSNATESSA